MPPFPTHFKNLLRLFDSDDQFLPRSNFVQDNTQCTKNKKANGWREKKKIPYTPQCCLNPYLG